MPITSDDSVREVIARHPAARAVFNRHGLGGCGGAEGPTETIAYFCAAHNVPLDGLLHELNDAVASAHVHPEEEEHGDACCTPPAPGTADTMYHKFVRGALLLCLLVGCFLGLFMLAYKALFMAGWVTESPAIWWFPHAQAHGYVQLFGWIGLFIMGIAYHVVPRFRGGTLPARELATASFWLMLAAVLLRMYFQPLASERWAAHIVIWSAGLGMASAILFANVMRKTRLAIPSIPQLHDGYLRWGVRWFLAASALNCAIAIDMLVNRTNVVAAFWNEALFHAFLVGFVLLFILGVSVRTLPLFLGLKMPSPIVTRLALVGINLGIVGFLAGTFHGECAMVSTIGLLLEAGAVIAFVLHLGLLWSGKSVDQGFEKFIRAAYGWLLLAVLLVIVGSLESLVAFGGAPRAALGAYRHIVTMGFVSMIIVGMAAKMVPTFEGKPLHSRGMLEATFWLLNAGVALRAVFQVMAEGFGGILFLGVGIGGFLEVLGLLLFALNIWKTLALAPALAPAVVPSTDVVSPEMTIADIVDRHPTTLDVFLAHGFGHLKNPIFRATMAKTITLRMACGMHHVELPMMVKELNSVAGGKVAIPS